MPSIVWGRHPQEAFDNPYEYAAQDQFTREVERFLVALNVSLNISTLRFHRDEHSLEKATWMLAHDLVDALHEGSRLISEKRHRLASRLFRDCLETVDLLTLLHSGTSRAASALDAWYSNNTVAHRECRQLLELLEGPTAAEQRRKYYQELSKFTHRTYRVLNASYSLGRDDLLVHDSYSKTGMLVLPHVLAAYLAVLADLVIQAADVLVKSGAIPADVIDLAWAQALEEETVPRRFAVRSGVR